MEAPDPNVAASKSPPVAAEPSRRGRSGTSSVDVQVLDYDSKTPESLTVTPDLRAVFSRAAAINGGHDGIDLTFSSLLLGLVTGRDTTGIWLSRCFTDQKVRIEHAYSQVGKDARAVAEAADRAMTTTSMPGLVWRRSGSARRAMIEAAEIAKAQGTPHLDAPHLVAAFISLTDYHEKDLGSLGLDRARWGAAFVHHRAQVRGEAELEHWKRFYERRFPDHPLPPLAIEPRRAHRPDYDTDGYTSHDLLDINDEVEALAYVISAENTHPPLAIGLFGEWGSGKTFFMKHLRGKVDMLCHGARAQPPGQRALHGHIVQVEFNAWHYQDGDLWASLVDHILRNLRFGEDEDETKLAERRDDIVRKIETSEQRQKSAAADVQDAEQRVKDAEIALDNLKKEQETRREQLGRELSVELLTAVRAGIKVDPTRRSEVETVLRELGIEVAGQGAQELHQALVDARRELNSFAAFVLPLIQARDRWRRIGLLSAAMIVPAMIGIVCHWALSSQGQQFLGQLSAIVTGAASFLVGAARWLRGQLQWVQSFRKRVEPLARDIDLSIQRQIEAQLVNHGHRITLQIEALDALKLQQTAAQRDKESASREVQALRAELARVGSDRPLRSFLDERLGGGEYQKRLGIAALVRRDFERLSRLLEQMTDQERKGKLGNSDLVINRVVLYIDDLDRCDSKKVVEVLRAVHLLLAFRAFVVVVAVDSRWIAHCLERHLDEVLVDNDGSEALPRVTPLDYLEKIFQIPIWLEPVPPPQRVGMARELLKGRRAPLPQVQRTPREEANDRAASSTGESPPPRKDGGTVPEDAPPATSAPQPSTAISHRTQDGNSLDLNPAGLDILDREATFLDELGELLSPSPRAIKRFVNTYRLINVGIARNPSPDDEQEPQDSDVRMFLLAILVGMPELSRTLQQALRETPAEELGQTLVERMKKHFAKSTGRVLLLPEPASRASEEWSRIEAWIEARRDGGWPDVQARRFAKWLDPVGRYTFNLTRAPVARLSRPLSTSTPPVRDPRPVPAAAPPSPPDGGAVAEARSEQADELRTLAP